MLIVQKYGGATVSTPEKIKSIAKKISEMHFAGHKLVIVVSAMGSTTNDLIRLAYQISNQPNKRELDMLLTTGERVSSALLTMALHDLKVDAVSLTGSQAGIITTNQHSQAEILEIRPHRILQAHKKNQVVVLAGFQGVCVDTKDITTLGRGGSDATALMMAATLKADRCEILKDVSGIFFIDPKLISNTKRLKQINHQQLLEMSLGGAKFLQYHSAQTALKYKVPVLITAAESNEPGTEVLETALTNGSQQELLSVNFFSENKLNEIYWPIEILNYCKQQNIEINHDSLLMTMTFKNKISEQDISEHFEGLKNQISDPKIINLLNLTYSILFLIKKSDQEKVIGYLNRFASVDSP